MFSKRLHIINREKSLVAMTTTLPPASVASLEHLDEVPSHKVQLVFLFRLDNLLQM
jgi:hypothetical protein